MFTQDDFSYIPIRSKAYNFFYKVNFDEDNPERTVKQCFSVLYDYGVFDNSGEIIDNINTPRDYARIIEENSDQ